MYSFYFAFSLVTLISCEYLKLIALFEFKFYLSPVLSAHSGIMQAQGEESKNLSSITWDHAVNSQQLLTEALKSIYYISYLISSIIGFSLIT